MSSLVCTDRPISWWRLECFYLGELGAQDQHATQAHLEACAACRACAQRIERGDALPALSTVPLGTRPARRWFARRAWLPSAIGVVALAAVGLVLWSGGNGDGMRAPLTRRVAVKGGGELVLDLIRERVGDASLAATRFAPNDRFKVVLTCSLPAEIFVDTVVFQDHDVFFPLAPARLACQNRVALPGAFRLSGRAPALVCVIMDAQHPVLRDGVTRPDSRAQTACVELVPERQ